VSVCVSVCQGHHVLVMESFTYRRGGDKISLSLTTVEVTSVKTNQTYICHINRLDVNTNSIFGSSWVLGRLSTLSYAPHSTTRVFSRLLGLFYTPSLVRVLGSPFHNRVLAYIDQLYSTNSLPGVHCTQSTQFVQLGLIHNKKQ
jgi:hypothetical protein